LRGLGGLTKKGFPLLGVTGGNPTKVYNIEEN